MKVEGRPITGGEERQGMSGPMRALTDFYSAFNGRDMEKMSANWVQTDEVSMDNPVGGIRRGWEEVRAVYERIFSGPASVHVEFHDYTMHIAGEIFYAVGRERGEFRSGGTIVPLAIRTSRIYRLVDGRWRQVHHHGSIDDPELLLRYQSAVKGG
jgi:ketosteroid isomerase-like protein